MIRKDWNFWDRISQAVAILNKKLKIFIFIFFQIQLFFFSKIICTFIFHSAMTFKQYQIYHFFKKIFKK